MVVISVKQGHIEAGIPGDDNFCPIALALHEMGPEYQNLSVGSWRLWDRSDGHLEPVADLPREATTFVFDFDKERTVHPFTFEVDL